jgi:hypothetical protein
MNARWPGPSYSLCFRGCSPPRSLDLQKYNGEKMEMSEFRSRDRNTQAGLAFLPQSMRVRITSSLTTTRTMTQTYQCRGIHPDEQGWAKAPVRKPREFTGDKPRDPARRNHRQYEYERDKGWQHSASRTESALTTKGRNPPSAFPSARVSRKATSNTIPAPASGSSWTIQPQAPDQIQSTSTANNALAAWASPPQDDRGWGSPLPSNNEWRSPVAAKDGGWGSPRANHGDWESPVRNNTPKRRPSVAMQSGGEIGLRSSANNPITVPTPQSLVSKPKSASVPTPTEPLPDKPTTQPASSLPPKPSRSTSFNPHPKNLSKLMEATPMVAPTAAAVRTSSTSMPAPAQRKRSASPVITLPPEFISPSPGPSVPPKPRRPALRLGHRALHSRRESIQATASATEAAPLSSISINTTFSVPLVSASPRTVTFAESPISAISAPASGGGLRIPTTPESIHESAEKAPRDPAEDLWDENIECVPLLGLSAWGAYSRTVRTDGRFHKQTFMSCLDSTTRVASRAGTS